MTRFIVDSSVAIPWVIPEIWSSEARLLLDSAHDRIAPGWIALENSNALWKRVRRAEITPSQARQILAVLPTYISYVEVASLVPTALDIAMVIGQTTYDSLYVALAEHAGYPLVTGDRSLYEAVRQHLTTHVIWIEDLPAAIALS